MSEAVRNGIEVRAVCPVTKGLPVRMTEHGFASACAAALEQAREAVKGGSGLSLAAVRLSRCLQCQGNDQPLELQLVDLELLKTERGSVQPEKELEMSGKTQDGTCENCGRKNMTLTKLHGGLVCSSCGNLFGAMVNRPEAVEKALRKLLPQFLPAEASGGEKERELAAEVQALGDQLADEQTLRKERDADAERYYSLLCEIAECLDSRLDPTDDVGRVPEMVRDSVSGHMAGKAQLQQHIKRLADENTALANRVSELEKRLEGLEEWEKIPALEPVLGSGYEQDLVRDQLADFALKVLQGQVGVVHREA